MKTFLALVLFACSFSFAQNTIDQDITNIEDKLIEWRRHFHQNPELSNQEFKTAEKIAEHLKSLGLEVET
ncbi:MAG: amidohydrolase, partial [Winogradskyella sp.]|nr:amidohydrolase [Winogradskyella sp.]